MRQFLSKINFRGHRRNHVWEDPFESRPRDCDQKHNAALIYNVKFSSNMCFPAISWMSFEWIFSLMIPMMALKSNFNYWDRCYFFPHFIKDETFWATEETPPPPANPSTIIKLVLKTKIPTQQLIVCINTEAKLCFGNICENTAKKQLYQMKKEKLEMSLKLAKTRLCVEFGSAI